MKVSIGQSVRGITINHDGRLRSFEPHSARLCGRVVAGGTLDLSKLLGMQYTVRRQGLARSNATCSCFQRCHRSRQPIVFPCTQGLAMFAMVLPSISSLRRAQVPGCPDVAFGLPVSKSPGPIRSRANRTWLALPSALRDLQIFYDSITIARTLTVLKRHAPHRFALLHALQPMVLFFHRGYPRHPPSQSAAGHRRLRPAISHAPAAGPFFKC
jgi:hypothetical protein